MQPLRYHAKVKTGLGALAIAVAFAGVSPSLVGRADAATGAASEHAHRHGAGGVVSNHHLTPSKSTRIGATLAASANISQWAVPVGNQSSVNSCVAWAIDYAMMGWYARHDGIAGQPFAPMYTYTQLDHGQNKPTYTNQALDIAKSQGNDNTADYGTANAAYWDYKTLPSTSQHANAARWKIRGYTQLTTVTQIETALANGQPVAIGFNYRNGFEAPVGNIDNDTTSAIIGGHEVLALGYSTSGLWIQNSWGTGWGLSGYAYLSWAVVSQDVTSAYTISGLVSASSTDVTPPTVTAPVAKPELNSSAATNGLTRYDVTWSANDASGIAATNLYYSMDGGTWTATTLSSATATSAPFNLTPGHRYQFAVSARDGAGNWSNYQYSPTSGMAEFQENSTYVSYTGQWQYAAFAAAVGGQIAMTSQANASTSFTFTGNSIAWIASRDTNRGKASVYFDGVYQGTWDLYAGVAQPRSVVLAWNATTVGTHTLRIVNQATAGRPTIDIDAFAITG